MLKNVIMSQRIIKANSRFTGSSRYSLSAVPNEKNKVLSPEQLRAFWAKGDKEVVKEYVKKHYLNVAMQVWLMRTGDAELIMIYLKNHQNSVLCDDAEELLMELKNDKLRKAYLDRWRLRHSSILLLFAEKQFSLLRSYIAKHPEELFSRLMLSLMFETGDKKLIRQYASIHPSLLEDVRYAEKLDKVGLSALRT